nr:hypothetical protein [Tanacetum cinerariifolium]
MEDMRDKDLYEYVSFQKERSRCTKGSRYYDTVIEDCSRSCNRVESTRLRTLAPKMLWAESVSTTYLIYHIPYVPIGLRIPEEEWQGKDTSLTHLKSLGGSLDTSEGSKNNRSFKGSGRSYEEDFKDGAFSEEEASRLHRYEDPPESPGLKDTKSSIHLVKNLKFCSWEKLVRILISEGSLSLLKILRTKNLAEMFTGLVMKEKLKFCATSTGLRRVQYVWRYRKVRAIALLKGRWFEVYRDYLRRRAVKLRPVSLEGRPIVVLGLRGGLLGANPIPHRDTKSSIHLVKNLKFCSWEKLVLILISEWSLSLLKILETKNLAEMQLQLASE